MTKPLSMDLRERLISAVEGGMSRRSAAERFGIAASTAIKWVDQWRQTGHVRPRRQGGDYRSHRIEAHAEEILALIKETPDITLFEIASWTDGARWTCARPWRRPACRSRPSNSGVWDSATGRKMCAAFAGRARIAESSRHRRCCYAPQWPKPGRSATRPATQSCRKDHKAGGVSGLATMQRRRRSWRWRPVSGNRSGRGRPGAMRVWRGEIHEQASPFMRKNSSTK